MRKTVSFSRHSANIFFHILTRCNLRCRHCYINPDQHGRNTLDIDTIERWLALFARRCPSANLIFLGGEPTLHPDLARAVKHSRRLGYASVTIDTNGYLFHDILERVTPEEVDFFSFSLDGPEPAVNDPLRGEGSFAQCTGGIAEARQRGFAVSLIYTVSRANIDHLHRMPALLADLEVNRFFIQVIGVRGQWIDDADRREALGQVDRET
ncbi:MAG TPA: radical SAM protein, partial [Desulfosarcina sp.]|nr:radical SAM protein [Desulfosarcina sp.]